MNGEFLESRFVGLPWAMGATGPRAYDCWQLVKAAAELLYGLEFPELPYRSDAPSHVAEAVAAQLQTERWQQIDEPEPGAVLALSGVRRGMVSHVALVVGNGRALHSSRLAGSQLVSLTAITQIYRLEGIYKWAR